MLLAHPSRKLVWEELEYQWSNVRYLIFRSYIQNTIFSQIKYNASSSNEGERFNVVFGLIGFDLWHLHLS